MLAAAVAAAVAAVVAATAAVVAAAAAVAATAAVVVAAAAAVKAAAAVAVVTAESLIANCLPLPPVVAVVVAVTLKVIIMGWEGHTCMPSHPQDAKVHCRATEGEANGTSKPRSAVTDESTEIKASTNSSGSSEEK